MDNGVPGSSRVVRFHQHLNGKSPSEKGNSLFKQNRPYAPSSCHRLRELQDAKREREKESVCTCVRVYVRIRESGRVARHESQARKSMRPETTPGRRRINRKVHESACTEYAPPAKPVRFKASRQREAIYAYTVVSVHTYIRTCALLPYVSIFRSSILRFVA